MWSLALGLAPLLLLAALQRLPSAIAAAMYANTTGILGVPAEISDACIGNISDTLSPNFSDVTRSCATLLSDDVSCKKCLNSGLSYLRHLVGEQIMLH
ncbi:hypothetical protein GUJ93_ZPchr0004g38807 [Zizania palustris]|uniref:Gnk2-homologous domain-containing protein n=1 Tax=Zizania palustris TaxID=103762 RepID=A0A8J5SAQ2_ZIZPA|nr:hypothetical protein GUJ93_ZPchr0004g38807 [Zizania palustris]